MAQKNDRAGRRSRQDARVEVALHDVVVGIRTASLWAAQSCMPAQALLVVNRKLRYGGSGGDERACTQSMAPDGHARRRDLGAGRRLPQTVRDQHQRDCSVDCVYPTPLTIFSGDSGERRETRVF